MQRRRAKLAASSHTADSMYRPIVRHVGLCKQIQSDQVHICGDELYYFQAVRGPTRIMDIINYMFL